MSWSPYEPTRTNPWDLRKVAHLHRRAGFGATWREMQRDLAEGPAASIDRFLSPPPETPAFRRVADALKHAARGDRERAFTSEQAAREARSWWLYRMAYGPDALGEKLTLFWHNHFATALHGVYSLDLMLNQNELLRRHARGRFGDLLTEIESDPAMLKWLDGGSNSKDHPNENFARELLELFTLGVGNYSESDVRAAARGLTGWRAGRDTLLNKTNQFTHVDELADHSTKTLLGQTGPWRRADVLRIILQQPATAEYLCRRLYRGFISENSEPDAELIRQLASEFRASNYSIQHVVGMMLRSEHFFSQDVYRQRVKSPVEFCVGSIRQLEPRRTPALLERASANCELQGQSLLDPPSVKGWEGGMSWLNSNTALTRMRWIDELLRGNEQLAMPPYDPGEWLARNAATNENPLRVYHELLLDGEASEATWSQAQSANAADWSDGLHVLLQSPEFHLA